MLRMLRRMGYGECTVEVRAGELKRIVGHTSHIVDDEMIKKEFAGNDGEVKRILSELKLNDEINGTI